MSDRRRAGATRSRSPAVAALAAAVTACVLPADDPTGLELSWSFLEGNRADGEDARRTRTCVGIDVERISVDVTDRDDPERQGVFHFPCDEGFQSQADLQVESSDAFVELHGGTYEIVLSEESEDLASRAVDIDGHGVTIEVWDLTVPPATWTLELVGATACAQLSLRLLYADPETALAEPPLDDDGEVQPTLYREMLASDRGLPVGGTAVPCAVEIEGTHAFVDVDRGAYQLEVDIDGFVCPLPVDVDAAGGQTVVDLANLPCAG